MLFDPLSKSRNFLSHSSYFFSFTVPLTVVDYHRRLSIEQTDILREHDSTGFPLENHGRVHRSRIWFHGSIERLFHVDRGGWARGDTVHEGDSAVRSSRGQPSFRRGRVKFDEKGGRGEKWSGSRR